MCHESPPLLHQTGLQVWHYIYQSWNSNILKFNSPISKLLFFFWSQKYVLVRYFSKKIIGLGVLWDIVVGIQIFWNQILQWHNHCSSGNRNIWLLCISLNNNRLESSRLFTKVGIQMLWNQMWKGDLNCCSFIKSWTSNTKENFLLNTITFLLHVFQNIILTTIC